MKKTLLTTAGILAAACGIAFAAPAAKLNAKAPVANAKPEAEKSKTLLAAVTPMPPAGAAALATDGASTAPPLSPEQSQFFENKVRPILTSACYKCHSIEQGKAKGGLTVDTRAGVLKGGENGAVIVAGNPDASKFIKAITYNDPDLQMPPKGEKLPEKDIAVLTEWIKMARPIPRVGPSVGKLTGLSDKARAHWAYQPVKNFEPPIVQNKTWVKTPVDNFVLAKLEAAGFKPSSPANKETLLRRATYDLTGLPPTPEELTAFQRDLSPNAFEKVVDRLLASPHYGERWGRYWLDSARYSDTSGQENNNLKADYRYAHAWTYRDYVISSFNADKPYDEFLKEQIAADLLPEASKHPERLAALGFLTVGKRFANPNDTIDERIDSLSKSTMAITVACARCHDHKFDPIPTADYYSLHGIFTSITEPAEQPLLGGAPAGKDFEDYKKKQAAIEAKNRDIYFEIVREQGHEFRSKAEWYLLANAYGRGGINSKSVLERTEIIKDHKLDRDLYQGLKIKGNIDPVFAPLMRFNALPMDKFAERSKEVYNELMIGKGGTRKQAVNPLVLAAFKDIQPDSLKSIKDVIAIYAKLFGSLESKAVEYVKANREAVAPGTKITGYDDALVELLQVPTPIVPAYTLNTEAMKEVARDIPQQNGKIYNQFLFNNLNELEMTHPGAPARAMIVAEGMVKNSPIFIRGEAQNRGPIVPHRFLEILAGPNRQVFKQGSGRLELAQSIASKDNPLTARVAINRMWMRHMGEGFVRTVDDIGVQSEAPSHPELVDYLATRFMADGWSFKKMHKLIMLSSAYQQVSDTNPAYAQKDPENRLIWRANLRRLDFEAVRDTLLLFTGHLDSTVGGKPVNLTEEPYSTRRSVYGYIDRGSVPELMQQFDFSDPDMTNTRRTTTIVPQQALFFMNSAMSADVARKVNSRPEFLAAKDDYAKVRAIYQVIFQRAPRPEEVRLAAEFYNAKVIADRNGGVHSPAPVATGKVDTRLAAKESKKLTKAGPDLMAGKRDGKKAIQNEGVMVERKPLTVWEEYTQALLFSNEIAYVN